MNFKTNSKKIAYTSIFAAFALLMNIFTFPDTPIGTLSLVYVPCFLAGIILGPVLGFTVGFVGDFLGCIISPKGPISLFILLSSGLLGLLSGIIFRMIKGENFLIKMIIVYFAVLIICTLGFSSMGNYFIFGAQNKYMSFWQYLLIARLPKQPFVLLVNCGLTFSLLKLLVRQNAFRNLLLGVRLDKNSN